MKSTATTSTLNPAQLRWRCHRGMRELDLILLPFFDKHFAKLTDGQQADFCQLLTHDDPQIYAWLLGMMQPQDARMQNIVDHIRTTHTAEPSD
jgi:antitoxin CptB